MVDYIGQRFLGVYMVVAKLRTTIVVLENFYTVDICRIILRLKPIGNLLSLTIYTSNGWNNPQFVADSGIAIGTFVPFECQLPLTVAQLIQFLVKGINQLTRQIGFQVVCMNMHPLFNQFNGMTYWCSIFNYIGIFIDLSQRNFMPNRDFLFQQE